MSTRLANCSRNSAALETAEQRLAEAQRIARIGSWEWDVEKVFYPVFPPDRNASEVLAWLESA